MDTKIIYYSIQLSMLALLMNKKLISDKEYQRIKNRLDNKIKK